MCYFFSVMLPEKNKYIKSKRIMKKAVIFLDFIVWLESIRKAGADIGNAKPFLGIRYKYQRSRCATIKHSLQLYFITIRLGQVMVNDWHLKKDKKKKNPPLPVSKGTCARFSGGVLSSVGTWSSVTYRALVANAVITKQSCSRIKKKKYIKTNGVMIFLPISIYSNLSI